MAFSSSSSDANFDDVMHFQRAQFFGGSGPGGQNISSGNPFHRYTAQSNTSLQSGQSQPQLQPQPRASSVNGGSNTGPDASASNTGFQFDILGWYPKYQSCQKYFLDHAQHDVLVQAFASFINILLPYQREQPIFSSSQARCRPHRPSSRSSSSTDTLQRDPEDIRSPHLPGPSSQPNPAHQYSALSISLAPYIRRLICTGMDHPQILHGFFGNDWAAGIGPQREQERRNYLFAAKSGGWASVKRDYDMLPLETVPFMRPLSEAREEEIVQAEKSWSEWLALEDWMVGSRAVG